MNEEVSLEVLQKGKIRFNSMCGIRKKVTNKDMVLLVKQ